MISNLQGQAGKYRSKGILLDTNLLLLLFVGLTDPQLVNGFKRARNQGFTDTEFVLLQHFVKFFSKIITTPYILAETSNFIYQIKGESRLNVLKIFRTEVQSFKERRPESKKLVQTEAFLDFGLTDCCILDLLPEKHLVLSVDASLVFALQKKGIDAINFNYLRQQNWLE